MKLLISWIVLLLAATLVSAQATQSKSFDKDARLPSAPTIEIDFQGDSPLKIEGSTKWVADGKGIEVAVKVENVSNRAIRAYATRNALLSDNSGRSCLILNIAKPGRVLQPGKSEVRSTWRGYPKDSKEPVHLTVDYVEFTDDSTWGIDSCQVAERLAGARAGARAFADRLQEILQSNGPEAVMKQLETVVKEIDVPQYQSSVWREGFRVALDSMVRRIREGVADNGLSELQSEIKKPYDASGYKIEVITPPSP